MAYDAELANRIHELVQGEEGLTEKRMFGGLAFLIDGNMAVSASSQAPWGDTFGMCVDKFGVSWLVNISGSKSS